MNTIPIRLLSRPRWPVYIPRRGISYRRTFNDAVDFLNSLQTPHAVYQARVRAGVRPDASFVAEMRDCLARIGHSPRDLDRLGVLHVAGTKGKGSTCAYVDAIINRWRVSRGIPGKIGMFTSPHLISVRERMRIDSKPVSEEVFTRCFFDVWDLLEKNPGKEMEGWNAGSYDGKPIYARYLTLMSWHLFLSEGVDVAVYETGIGGEYDATNVVERPIATAVTTLGVDHVFALGNTVREIAWHKAGIIKPGAANFTCRHEAFPEAEDVLKQRAEEKGTSIEVLDVDPRLEGVKIEPDADFQKKNATLGIALAEKALEKLDPRFVRGDTLPKEFIDGLENMVWHGRTEVIDTPEVRWHLDGAHTLDSLKLAGAWFGTTAVMGEYNPRALIFNQQGRVEAVEFLAGLKDAVQKAAAAKVGWGDFGFDMVVFCTNKTYAKEESDREIANHTVDAKEVDSQAVQYVFANEWRRLETMRQVEVLVVGSIEEAIRLVEKSHDAHKPYQVQALVTGSIHLVGGALRVLKGGDDVR